MLVPELGAYNGNIDNPQYQCWSKPVTWGITNIVRKSDSNYRMWLWMKIMQVQQLSRKQLTSGDPACCCFFVRNSGLVTLHEIISHKTVSDLPFTFTYGNDSIDYKNDNLYKNIHARFSLYYHSGQKHRWSLRAVSCLNANMMTSVPFSTYLTTAQRLERIVDVVGHSDALTLAFSNQQSQKNHHT